MRRPQVSGAHPKMSEAELSRAIVTALTALGCTVYSTEQGYRPGRGGTRTSAGIPDLIVFGPPGSYRFVFAELKVRKRKLTKHQVEFQRVARASRVACVVWRSVDDALAWLTRSSSSS